MNIKELISDLRKVDSEVKGSIDAQWICDLHWWVGIFQLDDDSERGYTWSYECCDEFNTCGMNEYDSFKSLEELEKYIIERDLEDWDRCVNFPEVIDD